MTPIASRACTSSVGCGPAVTCRWIGTAPTDCYQSEQPNAEPALASARAPPTRGPRRLGFPKGSISSAVATVVKERPWSRSDSYHQTKGPAALAESRSRAPAIRRVVSTLYAIRPGAGGLHDGARVDRARRRATTPIGVDLEVQVRAG